MFDQIIRAVLRSAVFLQVRNICGRSRFLPLVLIASAVLLAHFFGHAHAGSMLDAPGQITGDCVGGFSCSGGDPVLCSIAIADSQIACATQRTSKTVQDILQDGGFDKTLGDVAEPTSHAVGLGSSPGRTGSCPSSPTANVFGHQFTVDTAPICELSGVMGWFILIAASLFAARVLVGN